MIGALAQLVLCRSREGSSAGTLRGAMAHAYCSSASVRMLEDGIDALHCQQVVASGGLNETIRRWS